MDLNHRKLLALIVKQQAQVEVLSAALQALAGTVWQASSFDYSEKWTEQVRARHQTLLEELELKEPELAAMIDLRGDGQIL